MPHSNTTDTASAPVATTELGDRLYASHPGVTRALTMIQDWNSNRPGPVSRVALYNALQQVKCWIPAASIIMTASEEDVAQLAEWVATGDIGCTPRLLERRAAF